MSSRGESASGWGWLGSGWPALPGNLAPGFTKGLTPGFRATPAAATSLVAFLRSGAAFPLALGSGLVLASTLIATTLAGLLTDLTSVLALGAAFGADFWGFAGAALTLA